MAKIKLATGLKTYEIEDENGNVRGTISIDPKDINFIPRAKDFEKHIQDYIKKVDASNLETEDDFINAVNEADVMIKKELNELFNDDNASKVVFGKQNALNTLNGVTFVERFLEAIMPIITKEFEKEMKASSQRMEKYLK